MRVTRVVVIGLALVLSCVLGAADVQTQSASPTISPELRAQLEASIQRGVAYLMKNQKPDGSWDDYPGITALAATAILKQPGSASRKPALRSGKPSPTWCAWRSRMAASTTRTTRTTTRPCP